MTKEEIINKINELKAERDKLKRLYNVQDLTQHSYKIFLNSIYGVFGSAFFPCFDLDNAEAVTLSGQTVTREMVRYTNEILNELGGTANKEFVVAGDTDSFAYDTDITVNGKTISVGEFFHKLLMEGSKKEISKNGSEVLIPNKVYITDSIYGKAVIKNVMRHNVSKDCWKLCVLDKKPLYVTNDHSVIVYRNGELIECKPNQILKTDKLVVKTI